MEKVQRQRIASFIGYVFQLTYTALVDKLIQQEKLNHCNGCPIQHLSKNQHSCLMMDNDDAWMYYHDEVVEQIDLNSMLNATESIWSALGFKPGRKRTLPSCQILSWTSIYLTSLELDVVQQGDLQSRILYALYYGQNGHKLKDFGDQQETIECPDRVVRKDEQQWTLT